MTEKTEELKDIFVSVTDEETVTESQSESRGSLARDEEGVEQRLAAVVGRIRKRFEFRTSLDDERLAAVVREFFEGSDDAAIGATLELEEATVRRARLDCHLLRETDAPEDVDMGALRSRVDDPLATEHPSDGAFAAALDADREAVERAREVLAARARARSVSHRFHAEFEDVIAEAGLASRMTESVRDDGLDEATEDIDSLESDADVGF